MNSKVKLYWTLQLGCWAVYILINYLAMPLFDTQLPYSGTYFIFSFLNCVFLTHFYRKIINRRRWFELPIIKLVRNIFLGAIAITFIYFFVATAFDVVVFVFSTMVLHFDYPVEHVWGDNYWAFFYLSLVNVYAVFLLWTVFYFVFHYFETFQQVRYAQLLIQTQLKDATLQNLRNQINPHFLFNALNSIKYLTLNETDKARNAITLLSEILRYSLNSEHKTFVTLEEELNVVKDYLMLEKIRFGDRLNYTLSVEDKLLQLQIPPLLVMTLIENAIKHGISRLKNGGDVMLNAQLINNQLIVEVKNSGHLESVQSPNGIGLQNTKQRLQMLYNHEASFGINQKDENTVSATLQIPAT